MCHSRAIDNFPEKELAKAISVCRGGIGEANWIRNVPVTLLTTLKNLLFRVSLKIANGNGVREQPSL